MNRRSIQQEESEMIQNVFDLDDTAADEICTHRRDVVVLYMEDSDEEWERIISRTVTPFIRYAGKIRMILSIFWTPEIISAWMTDPEKLFCSMPVIHRFLRLVRCVPT